MEKYVELDIPDDVIGIEALEHMTNCVWPYRLENNIGFALISTRCNVGDQ